MEKRREDIRISVIVPIYNTEKYLNQCVDSILNQTHRNMEIFLVDDGSTDNTPAICDQYGMADERVKVIHKKQGGCWESRNLALDQAQGDYILLMDSDDFMAPESCEVLLENALKHDVPLSMCSYCFYYEGEKPRLSEKPPETKLMDSLEVMHIFQTDERISMIVPWGKLYKKELFEGIRYPDRTPDDEFVTYKLLWKSGKICYTDRQLYFFRQRMDSLTHTLTPRKLFDYLDSLLEKYDFFREQVGNAGLLQETALFNMEELCNIHFKALPEDKYTFYHQEYVRMYEACELRKRLKPARRLRYFAAARCPGLLMGAWKLKKRLKKRLKR